MSPNDSDGGAQSLEAAAQLRDYVRSGAGGRAFDSSAGFTLSTGAVRSPDAAWISPGRLAALSAADRTGYWRVCPDVVIEIGSPSDAWVDVQAKVDMYAREAARYALALDPQQRKRYDVGSPPDRLSLDVDAIFDA